MGRVHNSERWQNFPGIRRTATLGKLLYELLHFSLDRGLAVGLCDVDVDFCDIRVVHQRRLWTTIHVKYVQKRSILTIFHFFLLKWSLYLLPWNMIVKEQFFQEKHTCKASFIELISFSSLTQNLVTPIAWMAYNSSSSESMGLGFSSEEYRSSITLLAGSGRYRSFTLGAVIFFVGSSYISLLLVHN